MSESADFNISPGFDLPQQQWSLLNRFRAAHGHYGACIKRWRLAHSDLCSCSETQTMYQTVDSCPLTKLDGGLSTLQMMKRCSGCRQTLKGEPAYTTEEENALLLIVGHLRGGHFT